MLRKRRHLKGYTRDLSSEKAKRARRYLTPEGKSISRRAYEDIRARKRGFSSWREIQRASSISRGHRDIEGRVDSEDYARWLTRASKEHGVTKGELENPDSEFNRLLAKAADDDWSHEAGGTFDDFLQYVGVRDEGADYDIGDTNAK